jgi:hypothetical protein
LVKFTLDQWKAEGTRLFGSDHRNWKFKCPQCGNVQSYRDFEGLVDHPEDVFFFSCIGRWKKGVGCDWTLGGLFQIHNVEVTAEDGTVVPSFEFSVAPQEIAETAEQQPTNANTPLRSAEAVH